MKHLTVRNRRGKSAVIKPLAPAKQCKTRFFFIIFAKIRFFFLLFSKQLETGKATSVSIAYMLYGRILARSSIAVVGATDILAEHK